MKDLTKSIITATGFTNNKLYIENTITDDPSIRDYKEIEQHIKHNLIGAIARHIQDAKPEVMEWSYYRNPLIFGKTYRASCWVFTDYQLDELVTRVAKHVEEMYRLREVPMSGVRKA